MFDAVKVVEKISEERFKTMFIERIGRDALFSKMRCGNEDALKMTDWKKIKKMYAELGVEEEMNREEMVELAYALTRRAVIEKK